MPNEPRRPSTAPRAEKSARPASRPAATRRPTSGQAPQAGQTKGTRPTAARSAAPSRNAPNTANRQTANRQQPAKQQPAKQQPVKQRELTVKEKEKALRKQQRNEKIKKSRDEIKAEFKSLTSFNKDAVRPDDIVRVRGGIDRPMLIIILILVCFGSVMVFTSSYAFAFSKFGDSYYFIRRQLGFVAAGLLLMFAASFFDYRVIRKLSRPYFLVVCALLVLVLLKGVSAGEAQRWIYLGFISFQPSEFMKLGLAMTLADYYQFTEKQVRDKRFWVSSTFGTFLPLLILAIACGMVVLENHLSGTIILFVIGIIIIFCAGGKMVWLAGGAILFGGVVGVIVSKVDYVQHRIDIFRHPENYEITGDIWQTMQGEYAVGSGGMLGVGLGESRQKHLFISQPQNDYIYSVICEELGFVGAVIVIALFAVFVWRGYTIAMKAPDTFCKLTVIGIVTKVGIQALLNIAVVTNTIPNTGVTLPFFSYGGSALMILLLEMGIILAISRYSIEQK